MDDARLWHGVEIRIEHADSDDYVTVREEDIPLTLADAIMLAKLHVIATWDEHRDENAAANGFPYYGISIEFWQPSDGSTSTLSCQSAQLEWADGVIAGTWNVDNGIMEYQMRQ